ncbi:MAG: HEAT repeat domain-containing protein [Gemmatimonadota bacterium]|nr:HEAT repeat domain-containing protein [Gemmatimonadota bacterium]
MNSVRVILGITLAISPLPAQSIADRVAAAPDGQLQLRYPARPGVCGDGAGAIGVGAHTYFGEMRIMGGNWQPRCVPGPVRVLIAVRSHAVETVRVYVSGDGASTGPALDLGSIAPQEAADFLLDVAPRVDRRSSEQALLAAMIGEGTVVTSRLFALARDSSATGKARHQAIFWLGQLARAAVNGRTDWMGDDVADDPGDQGDERKSAIFALSQLPHHEGVPALIEVIRTNRNRALKSAAIFWLADSGDPRAVELFETLLRAR